MQIKVTQEHIDKGCKAEATNCPVALALQEATGLYASVYRNIYLYLKDNRKDENMLYERKTPKEVLERIQRFDRNKGMEPFEFEIDYENQSNTESH